MACQTFPNQCETTLGSGDEGLLSLFAHECQCHFFFVWHQSGWALPDCRLSALDFVAAARFLGGQSIAQCKN